MILSEFEQQEGYESDLNWQTKSRLDMLSSNGNARENGGHSNGLHADGGRFGLSGKKKFEKQPSLLPPEMELSHSQSYLSV